MRISFFNGTTKEIANLREADLCGADLCGADLRGADLRGADLRGADLCGANLREADLCEADLRGADLRGADLRGADLCGADLCGADLRGAKLPPPQMMLLAQWGVCSNKLTADLMEYDASSHADRVAFDTWAATGACPYDYDYVNVNVNVNVTRAANFKENRTLWGKGKIDTPYNLMLRVFAEHEVKI